MIYLTDNLVLVADEHCYIIGKPRQRPDKGTVLDAATYHRDIRCAVLSAIDRSLRSAVKDGSITTLRQFLDEEERLTAKLKDLLVPLEVQP